MLNLVAFRAFSDVMEETYSGSNGRYKVTSNLTDNSLVVTYKSIFQFSDNTNLGIQVKMMGTESEELINDLLKRAKKAYREAEEGVKALSVKLVSDVDNVEVVGNTIYSPKRTAYYTRKITYAIDS